MEASAATPVSARARSAPAVNPAAAGAWALGFLPVFYLAMRGGGYDAAVRNEVGFAVWWIVLIGAALGVLPTLRLRPAAWSALGLLAAFAAWTALGIGWSESAERSVAELTRVLTYLGVLTLAVVTQRRNLARHAVGGVATAIGAVALLAVLSRLHPAWFHSDAASSSRLSYPLNYSNALGPLLAMGMPLALALATSARTLLGQALAAASLPVIGLGLFLTVSRGGVIAAILALIVFVALAPQRLPRLGAGLVGGAGTAILIAAVAQRDALQNGLSTQLAHSQGNDVLALLVIVCAGTALVQVALGLATRHLVPPEWVLVSRRATRATAVTLVGVVAAVAVFATAGGGLSGRWSEFKDPLGASHSQSVTGRLGSVSGSGRYQYWRAALDAAKSEPVHGIGPGSYEYWWQRSRHWSEYARNAHSLYFETLAETGFVGLALLLAFFGAVLVAGVRRAFTGPGRIWVAAATGGCVAFLAGAATEWTWQVPAGPIAFLILAAAVVTRGTSSRKGRALRPRAALAVCAVLALPVLAIHLAATSALRSSQAQARAGHLGPALTKAHLAERLQPYAAGPRLQTALVLEAAGDRAAAARSARRATEAEPNSWRAWLVRSRLDAERGDARASVADFRRAHALFPTGLLTNTE